jgi:hypothetical protein
MNQPATAGLPAGRFASAAEPIVSNQKGSFAWTVLAQRHPALIDQVRAAHPYGLSQLARLDALHEEITSATISPLPDAAHDHVAWLAWSQPDGDGRSYYGQSWFDVPFLWAESYFYRRLLDAVGYYGAGPWAGVDPFEPAKSAELAQVDQLTCPVDRQELLSGCLWGNQADLGFRAGLAVATSGSGHAQVRHDGHRLSDPSRQAPSDSLLIDDSQRLWHLLAGGDPGKVIVVADNAGRELLADLLLIDYLLASYAAEQVVLHVKPAPYYVSDATPADLSACLRTMRRAGAPSKAAADRLTQAAAHGALVIGAHPFYCSPLSLHHLPADLAAQYASARLVLLKGDLNYRRLVGDTSQPATTSFAQAAGHFPAPVAVVRTLKSDVVVGLDPATLARLDATGTPWRTTGTHAVLQVRA